MSTLLSSLAGLWRWRAHRAWIGIPILLALAGSTLGLALVVVPDAASPPSAPDRLTPALTPAPTAAAPSTEPPIPAAPAPPTLRVVDYEAAPTGFPADPDPLSTTHLTEGLRPTARIAAYDAPGGRPLAFFEPTLSGVPLVMPIVTRRANWAAVLLPSANRTTAWVPVGGWQTVLLRDLLVVERRKHRLTWYRDARKVETWPVTLGLPSTPTPLGRTFILGRSTLPEGVYADTDVFALGAVPDDPDAVPAGLRGAHIGLHTWYNDDELGKNTTDGCIRLTRSAQRRLLVELAPGTPLVVVDRI